MTTEERSRARVRRLLDSRRTRKLAISGMLGIGGAGGAFAMKPPPKMPRRAYDDPVKEAVAQTMLERQSYRFDKEAKAVMADYIRLRRAQPHFANARSIRNALDRARLRQANRLFEGATGTVSADELSTIRAEDIAASRVFTAGMPDSATERS